MTATVDIIEKIEQLVPLQAEWDRLADRQQNPLIGFDWFYCCAKTINREDPIRVVVVRRNGDIIGIAPLCLRVNRGVLGLELLGSMLLGEPADLLYEDTDALALLLQHVARLRYPVVLLRIPDKPHWRRVIDRLRWKTGPIFTIGTAASTVLHFELGRRELLSHLSSRRRNDIRRKRRRLGALGAITSKFICPNERQFSKTFDAAIAVEDRSWKGRQGSSLLKNAKLREFFEAYTHMARERGTVRFCFLCVDEQPIAMQIAILEYSTLWILKLGYDEAFARCSPGFDLTTETFNYCATNGVRRYEFLGSEELWQDEWPVERRHFMAVIMFPYGWRGLFGLGRFARQFFVKRLGALKAGILEQAQRR